MKYLYVISSRSHEIRFGHRRLYYVWRHIATGFAKFSRGKPRPTQIVVCKQLLQENSFNGQLLFQFVLYDSLTLIKSSGTFFKCEYCYYFVPVFCEVWIVVCNRRRGTGNLQYTYLGIPGKISSYDHVNGLNDVGMCI